ncbi:DUF2971 domain-containing protein [Dysgonomonas capnocytophagoides]|uniref:DUF2971 domain-containing protein n=1 Tax=Dysgonomonas capnocytophagoides TaxID=45254 RepID=UPI00040E1968|nr:DUF2971 domain-containing protein [Dysgonomonas capnocytophagoides]
MKWQNRFIRDIIDFEKSSETFFAKSIEKDTKIVNTKGKYLPETLLKFYSPTHENVQDVKNKCVWMSSPSSFNDPFDCSIGYNSDEYIKYLLIDYIRKNNRINDSINADYFTKDDLLQICNTFTTEPPYNIYSNKRDFSIVCRSIVNSKSNLLQGKYNELIFPKIKRINAIIENARHHSVRVACFSELRWFDESIKKMLLWSHYSDSHRGFCVEYDISSLKNDINYEVEWYAPSVNPGKYIDERIIATLKAGLFPISYSNKRTLIPKTLLNKLAYESDNTTLSNPKFKELIIKSFINKSTVWNYEKEWRLIVDDKICKYYDNKIPFPYIKSIFVGSRASKELVNNLYDIANSLGVEIHHMKETDENYALYHWILDQEYLRSRKKFDNPFL